MNTAEYLSEILLGQSSEMISEFIFVILPVLSITVIMFGLRSILFDYKNSKLRRQ